MTPAESVADMFKGRQFDQEVIVLCVRWYLRYKMSARDLVEMMAERGVVLVHTTILRWVQRYVPELVKRWSQYARPVGGSWRCDETYIKVKGPVDLSVPGGGQSRANGRFLSQREAGCKCCETVLPQSDEECWHATRDHARCLCRITSCGARTEGGRLPAAAGPSAVEQVPQ